MTASPWRSLRFRLIWPAALGVGLGLIVAALLLAFVYRTAITRSFDQRLEVILDFLIVHVERDHQGHLVFNGAITDERFERAYSGWYWQVALPSTDEPGAAGRLLRSRSLFDTVLTPPAAIAGAGAGPGLGPLGKRLRIVRRDIEIGSEPATFLVAADHGEIDAQVSGFLAALTLSVAALAAGLAGALTLQVTFALAPMRRVREALAAVRDGRAARLEGVFVNEVEPLAQELNQLLEQNAAVLDRARTQVGNLAHALKTPLSVLRNDVDADAGTLRETVRREAEIMRRQIDHYLARARAAASARVLGARVQVRPVAEAIARTMEKIHRDRSVRVETICPEEVAFRGETADLEEIIGNLADNGAKWGRTLVRINVRLEGADLLLTVEDDGPGLKEGEREAVLTRGARLDESVPGSGLGLSIVKDLVELYGGRLDLAQSSLGGLAASARLPAARSDRS